MLEFEDEGLLTSFVPYLENDAILRVFLKKRGRINAFYKGAFNISSKKPFSLLAPAFCKVSLKKDEKSDFYKIKSLDFDPGLFSLSSSLAKLSLFYYIAEIIESLLSLEEEAQSVFIDAKNIYQKILEKDPDPKLIRAFELKLLLFMGYLPELNKIDYKILSFDPIESKFLSYLKPNAILFSNEALELAKKLVDYPIDEIFCEDISLLKTVGKLFFARLKLLGKDSLKSVSFFKQMKEF